MNPFPDKLVLEDAGMRGSSRVFTVCSRFRYLSSLGCITVPRFFDTDGASIPRVFWNILSPFGDYFKAAVVHDYLYSRFNEEFTRDEADFIFFEAMYNVGVPWHRRHIIHAAVRAFGWTAYRGKLK
jgi:hypothetical protein